VTIEGFIGCAESEVLTLNEHWLHPWMM